MLVLVLLVGYHGELKVNVFHNTRIIQGLYYPKKVKGYLLYFSLLDPKGDISLLHPKGAL